MNQVQVLKLNKNDENISESSILEDFKKIFVFVEIQFCHVTGNPECD